jgi:hypothetical protein
MVMPPDGVNAVPKGTPVLVGPGHPVDAGGAGGDGDGGGRGSDTDGAGGGAGAVVDGGGTVPCELVDVCCVVPVLPDVEPAVEEDEPLEVPDVVDGEDEDEPPRVRTFSVLLPLAPRPMVDAWSVTIPATRTTHKRIATKRACCSDGCMRVSVPAVVSLAVSTARDD